MAKRIGELLVEAGVLSQSQLEQALFAQRKDGRKLGQLLIELGLVTETQLTQTLSRQLSVPWVSLYHIDFSRSLLNLLSREIADRYSVVPILVRRTRRQGDTLYIAMDDPTNDAAIDEVSRAAALPVRPMIACPSDIRAAIRVYYFGEPGGSIRPPFPANEPPSETSTPSLPAEPPPPRKSPPSVVQRPARPRDSQRPPPPATAPVARIGKDPAKEPPSREGASKEPPGRDAPESTAGAQAKGELPPSARRARPKMIALTLLDGTSISIPAPSKRGSKPDLEAPPGEELSDQLTARDLISALRAVAHGAEAHEILGTQPRWEVMFSALLSILLRKGLIADWEFIEEFRKV